MRLMYTCMFHAGMHLMSSMRNMAMIQELAAHTSLPTNATICRHAPLYLYRRPYYCQHVPNAPMFATLRNVTFPFPFSRPPPPPPLLWELARPAQFARPAARMLFLPVCPAHAALEMARVLQTFSRILHDLPTWYTDCRQMAHRLPTRATICRRGALFADKGPLRANVLHCLPTWHTI
jgi:hypothetical protein